MGQNSIIVTQPNLPIPESCYSNIFMTNQFSNPVYLNGRVKEVSKNTSAFDIDCTKAILNESFNYTLNRNKEVTKYASNIEFDEMNPEKLNSEKSYFITVDHDTTINHDGFVYTIKNSKILAIECKQNIYGTFNEFVDSTAYIYEKDNLVRIEYFEKAILEDEFEEILISDYQLVGLEIAEYWDENILKSKSSVRILEYEAIVNNTSYQFNRNSQLRSFTVSKMTVDVTHFDENLELIKTLVNDTTEDTFHGTYIYDNKTGLISQFETTNKDSKIKYLVTHKENETYISSYINYELIATDTILYDEHQNPIELKHYEIIDGKRFLDSNTKLQITYFK